MKYALPFLVICLVVIIVWFFYKKSFDPNFNKDTQRIKIGEKEVFVEIADTPAKRAKGLMFRKSLDENEGMFFIFENEGYHSFWMANTYIPLDIIWFDSDMNIVHIERNVPTCTETGNLRALCKSYRPGKKAKYVLEVNAGWVDSASF